MKGKGDKVSQECAFISLLPDCGYSVVSLLMIHTFPLW